MARNPPGNGSPNQGPPTEILGPEPEHAYNDPTLSPQEFLLAVMHDRKMPMSARIDAAAKVSVYMHPRLAQVSQDITAGLKIVIEGGLPQLPGTNIIMPGESPPQRSPGETSRQSGNGSDTTTDPDPPPPRKTN